MCLWRLYMESILWSPDKCSNFFFFIHLYVVLQDSEKSELIHLYAFTWSPLWDDWFVDYYLWPWHGMKRIRVSPWEVGTMFQSLSQLPQNIFQISIPSATAPVYNFYFNYVNTFLSDLLASFSLVFSSGCTLELPESFKKY